MKVRELEPSHACGRDSKREEGDERLVIARADAKKENASADAGAQKIS